MRSVGQALLGVIFLLLDATVVPQKAEGCAGIAGDGGGSGPQDPPPEPPACTAASLDAVQIEQDLIPSKPGKMDLQFTASCASPQGGTLLGWHTVELRLRDEKGAELGIYEEKILLDLGGSGPSTTKASWTLEGELAPGTYTLSARLADGEPRTDTFQVESTYAPELGAGLLALVETEADESSPQVCCTAHNENYYCEKHIPTKERCVASKENSQAQFTAYWDATPWTTTKVSWDSENSGLARETAHGDGHGHDDGDEARGRGREPGAGTRTGDGHRGRGRSRGQAPLDPRPYQPPASFEWIGRTWYGLLSRISSLRRASSVSAAIFSCGSALFRSPGPPRMPRCSAP